jgi:myb proto-oncogene protein
MVPGRTDKQCRNRWVSSLDPANGKSPGKWTPEEDAKLTEAVKKHGKNEWVAVAAMVPGRTGKHCRQRWVESLDPANGNRGKWTPEEDAKLAEAVKNHGKKWVAVAMLVSGRTGKRCRERWVHSLDPTNGKKVGKLTPEEDAKVTKAVKKHGNEWAAVSAMVSGRTNVQCRDRWVHTLDRANGKIPGKWTPEEDAKLTKAAKKHGKEWVAVAAMVPGRTNVHRRRRWVNTLDRANEKKVNRHQKKTKAD